jgi:hypothetical protein
MSRPESVGREDGAIPTVSTQASIEGGQNAGTPDETDYRSGLRSRRWDAAPLRNPEVEKTDPRIAVAFIALLSGITLVVLVLGYASGFWQLPA